MDLYHDLVVARQEARDATIRFLKAAMASLEAGAPSPDVDLRVVSLTLDLGLILGSWWPSE